MPVSLRQIAEHCGMSRQTVGQILNGSRRERFHPETQRRVLAAAASLGYRPNAAALAVATGRFGAVGYVFRANLDAEEHDLLKGICAAGEQRGLRVHVAMHEGASGELPQRVPVLLRELSVDGLLVHRSQHVEPELIELIRSQGTPTVWLNADGRHDCVHPDDAAAFAQASAHLIAAGHRRIAYVAWRADWGAPQRHYSYAAREAGYRRALQRAGLAPRIERADYPQGAAATRWGGPGDDRLARARALLTAPDRPSAVLCAAASDADCLLLAARDLGLALPQALSVVVCSGGAYRFPEARVGLLRVPLWRLGQQALALLQRKLAAPERPLPSEAVPYELEALAAAIHPPAR